MRHRRDGYKLGRDKEQRVALYRGLMISIIEHRKIKTTIT
ncbi:MAG: 50S ribosomal protein L17, partial [Chloroflexota bacterium]